MSPEIDSSTPSDGLSCGILVLKGGVQKTLENVTPEPFPGLQKAALARQEGHQGPQREAKMEPKMEPNLIKH